MNVICILFFVLTFRQKGYIIHSRKEANWQTYKVGGDVHGTSNLLILLYIESEANMEERKCGISFQITPLGEIEDGKKLKVSIQVPFEVGWIERMKFLVTKGGERTTIQLKHVRNDDERQMVYFEGNVELPNYAIYYYCFSFEANRIFRYFKRKDITDRNCVTLEECWKMSVGFETPIWAKGANMYHIFVDRFRRGGDKKLEQLPRRVIHEYWDEPLVLGPDKDGNWNIDFYGGNLKGIEECIHYLKNMGITILYLSPIMRSQSNHRYDTADYEEVDPYAGTNEGLKSLCDAAHRCGMYVILDAVFNHTGNDSKYYNQFGTYESLGAYQSEESPYTKFYRRYWDGTGYQFSYWWGMKNLPECDGYSPEWKSYTLGEKGVLDKWFALGIDGLRADVADELTDEYIEGMRSAIKRNKPDGFFIGEVWKNPMRMNRGYLSSGKGMDTVMNYLFVDSLIRYFKYADCDKLKGTIHEIQTEYPEDTILTLMNFTSTHDISRAIEIFGCDNFQKYGEWSWNLQNDSLDWIREHKLTRQQYKFGRNMFEAYLFALTFTPGILSIFYGDEVGVEGIGNLANRATYPWGKRDKKLLEFVKECLRIRNREECLKTADWNVISIDYEKFIFERTCESQKILVVVSRSHMAIEYSIPEAYENSEILFALHGGRNTLGPYGAIALKI